MSSMMDLRSRQQVLETQRLAGMLHQVLEIDDLIDLFARELGRLVASDGLRYGHPDQGIELLAGDQAAHSCAYDLTLSGQTLGKVQFFRQRAFTPIELETIENHLAALIYPLNNSLKYHSALQSAFIDPLTGVKNRAAMDNALRREIELSRRRGAPMSLIMFDVDHFKRLNDTQGHAAGDRALQTVARAAEQSIRSSDMLYRYGGEEFLILLSYTEGAGAMLLAERIRSNIERQTAAQFGSPITVSLGVASLRRGEDAAGLFQRTDAALYRAKQLGRNRVEVD